MRVRGVEVRVVALLICAFAVIGGAMLAVRYEQGLAGQRDAERVVAAALVAMRNADARSMSRLLYSQSGQSRWIKRHPDKLGKALREVRDGYGLDRVSKAELVRSVKAVPQARRDIVESIIKFYRARGYSVPYTTWNQDQPVAVRFVVRGTPMVTVALRENGAWRVGGIPVSLKAEILRYHSVTEAMDRDAAWLEPPYGAAATLSGRKDSHRRE